MAYTPFTPINYPSGSRVFDIYCVELAEITGGVLTPGVVKFSNPFIVIGAYVANVNKYASFQDFQATYMPTLWSYQNNSGILKQLDSGIGPPTEAGAIQTIAGESWKMFWLNDYLRNGMQLTDGAISGTVESLTEYPEHRNTLDLLERMENNFDTIAYPPNQNFEIDPAGNRVFIFMAVKRGNNQPFFTVTA